MPELEETATIAPPRVSPTVVEVEKGTAPQVAIDYLLENYALPQGLGETKKSAIIGLRDKGKIVSKTYEDAIKGYSLSTGGTTVATQKSAAADDSVLAVLNRQLQDLSQFLKAEALDALRDTLTAYKSLHNLGFDVNKLVEKVGEMATRTLHTAETAKHTAGVAHPLITSRGVNVAPPSQPQTPATAPTTAPQSTDDKEQHPVEPNVRPVPRGPTLGG